MPTVSHVASVKLYCLRCHPAEDHRVWKNNQRTLIQVNLCFDQNRSGHRARRTRGALLLILPVSAVVCRLPIIILGQLPGRGMVPSKAGDYLPDPQRQLGETDRGPCTVGVCGHLALRQT